MEILYRERVHGNEPTSLFVGKMLRTNPVEGVDILVANEISGDQRFGDYDMDLTTRDPTHPHQMDEGSHLYEARQAQDQWRICNNYPLTIAPHDAAGYPYYEGYACVGRRTHPDVLRVVSFLGISTVMLDDFGFTIECPRGLCVETRSPPPSAADYQEFMEEQAAFLIKKLGELTTYASLQDLPPAHDLEFLEFFQAFSLVDVKRLGLEDFSVAHPFQPMPTELSERLGTPEQLFAINWDFRNSSNGAIFGAVATKAKNYAYAEAISAA